MSSRIRSGLYERMLSFAEGLLALIAQLPSFLLAPFLAYYMVKDYDHFKKRFLAFLPPEFRGDLVHFLREADLIFSNFLRGHLLVSAVVGFLTGLGAALIGLRFFLLIGIFTALADLIPFLWADHRRLSGDRAGPGGKPHEGDPDADCLPGGAAA